MYIELFVLFKFFFLVFSIVKYVAIFDNKEPTCSITILTRIFQIKHQASHENCLKRFSVSFLCDII